MIIVLLSTGQVRAADNTMSAAEEGRRIPDNQRFNRKGW